MDGSRPGAGRKSFSGNLRRPVVIGWIDSQKVFLEEILPASVAVAPSIPMPAPGNEDELESLRYQLGKLAETFSHLRFNAERNESREKTINISQASITDTDVAREATKLAKNLIVKEATNSALIQARISAETVFNLLV